MRLSVIIVMQTTQDWARDYLPNHLWLCLWHRLARDSLPNSLVGPRMVEVFLVLLHYAIQVPLAEDHEVVQTLSTHAAQESFTDRVCLWCLIWCAQHLNPCS